jgi:hypothetical protein
MLLTKFIYKGILDFCHYDGYAREEQDPQDAGFAGCNIIHAAISQTNDDESI